MAARHVLAGADMVLSNTSSSSRDACPAGSERARPHSLALALAVILLVLLAARALFPLWLPLLLAAWFSDLARPLSAWLAKVLRGQRRAASLVAVLLVVLVLTPLSITVLSLADDAERLVRTVLESQSVESAFNSLVAGPSGAPDLGTMLLNEPRRALELLENNGPRALGLASSLAGATLSVVIGMVVFVMAFYVFLVHGPGAGAWFESHAPLSQRQFRRLAVAFHETGRGLIVGVGLAAVAQGAIAGIGYVVVGLPHAFVLALLTAMAALVPSLGSGLVWLPVAAVLALSGRLSDAAVVFVVGSIAGVSDNFIRPYLSRYGQLQLPTFVLFCAMLGGVMAFGAAGLIVGPLFVRFAVEGLRLWREREAPLLVEPRALDSE